MCMICGQTVAAHASIAVTPDGLVVHRGTCLQRWKNASGFERSRWIGQRRTAPRGYRQPGAGDIV